MVLTPTDYFLANMILFNNEPSQTKPTAQYVIFVYGTLKSGYGNNYLLKGAECLGGAKTVEKYALYEQGIPYVVKSEPVAQIQGEVYLVDSATLARLDQLEGHPGWYYRELIPVILDRDIYQLLSAWIYFYPYPKGRLLPDGQFK